MLDRIFATIGMLGVVAFMGVVAVFVMEPDLWIVTISVLAIGIVFLWRDVRDSGGRPDSGEQGGTGA